MTRKETALNALHGERTDRLPVAILSGGVWMFKRRGMSIGESVRVAPSLAAEIVAETYKEIGSDILWTGSGCNNLVIKALGGKVNSDEIGVAPEVEEPLIKKADEVDRLDISRIMNDDSIGQMQETARILVENCGDDFLIGCGQWGPFTLAGQLLGIRMLMRLMIKDPPALEYILEFTREVCLKYWQLFIEVGVGLVRMSEMSASGDLLSKKLFEQFVLPSDTWLMNAISGKVSATELVSNQKVKVENNKFYVNIPAQRTQVIHITK